MCKIQKRWEEARMEKIQKVVTSAVSKASDQALCGIASFMVRLSDSAVSRSAVPFWHNEPKMPQSMLDEIKEV